MSFCIELDKLGFNIKNIDLGGGIGINYDTDEQDQKFLIEYTNLIKSTFKNINKKIILEPGRFLVANAGILVASVLYKKTIDSKNFLIIDAGMNDLMRPALYGATHKILPSIKKSKNSKKIHEFVGPICESTDKFCTLNKFQKIKEKDLVVICDVGAYGMTLSSNYNLRTKPIELLISGAKIKVIKKRQKYNELI